MCYQNYNQCFTKNSMGYKSNIINLKESWCMFLSQNIIDSGKSSGTYLTESSLWKSKNFQDHVKSSGTNLKDPSCMIFSENILTYPRCAKSSGTNFTESSCLILSQNVLDSLKSSGTNLKESSMMIHHT